MLSRRIKLKKKMKVLALIQDWCKTVGEEYSGEETVTMQSLFFIC